MTLLELEAAIYDAPDLRAAQTIISRYVEQEREKASVRKRRSRATQAEQAQSQRQNGDAPRARVVSNQNQENRKSLPSDWQPSNDHLERVVEEGREASYLTTVKRLFRAWVAENEVTAHDWNERFSQYLEVNFLMFPKAGRAKKAKAPAQERMAVSEPLPEDEGLSDEERACLSEFWAGTRLTIMEARYPSAVIASARKAFLAGRKKICS